MDHLRILCLVVSHAFASVHCCLVVTCWETADLFALVCDVNCIFVTLPCGILGQAWYLNRFLIFAVFLTLFRQALTKLKISAQKLEMKNGRYNKITREQRICKLCSLEVEDELHFLITCQKLSQRLNILMGKRDLVAIHRRLCNLWLLSPNSTRDGGDTHTHTENSSPYRNFDNLLPPLRTIFCTPPPLRGYIYLSKVLTCMNFFLYKQKLLFYKGDGYLWLHCCMKTLYILPVTCPICVTGLTYITLRPNIQLLSNRQHAYQSF